MVRKKLTIAGMTSVYLFGAICHARGVGEAAIIMPTTNTEAMNEHLKEISTQVSPGAHAVLVCRPCRLASAGQALAHAAQHHAPSATAYSPELNPNGEHFGISTCVVCNKPSPQA